MKTGRLEAFSDGVLAIIITIMVLGVKVPDGVTWTDLKDLFPTFLTYLVSFIYVGIYWNNHHHLFQVAQKVNGRVLWANLHLLFWLSLLPLATGWLGNYYTDFIPVAFYGFILLMSATAWEILARQMINYEGKDSDLAQIYRNDRKKYISIVLYFIGIALAYLLPFLSLLLYLAVALLWFIPDKRFERN